MNLKKYSLSIMFVNSVVKLIECFIGVACSGVERSARTHADAIPKGLNMVLLFFPEMVCY